VKSNAFERLAGTCAVVAALGGIAYGVAFVILGNQLVYSVLLMLNGLLAAVILVALYQNVRQRDESWALLALLLGVVGLLGSVAHGGYDLANAIHPPTANALSLADFPSQIDARGLLTFGFTGVGILIVSALMSRADAFPTGLSIAGLALGVLMIVIYLGRLIILDPTNLIVRIALLAGVIVNTIWYLWLGVVLRRKFPTTPQPSLDGRNELSAARGVIRDP
jgi:hypothetical protein